MRILHWSDNHGHIPSSFHGKYDVNLNTGDFFPNSHWLGQGEIAKEQRFQLQWLRDNVHYLKEKLQGHPFLYIPGNHCMLPANLMEFELQAAGIEAYSLTDRIFTFKGVNFYGHPYVPYIDGGFNYERKLPEMQEEVNKMVTLLNSIYVDVLACHCPPYGCLDLAFTNTRYGCTCLANALDYKISKDMIPQVLLCGHVHDPCAVTMRNGLLVSNAATTQHIIEI